MLCLYGKLPPFFSAFFLRPTWHIGGVRQVRKQNQKLRFSMPPYCVATVLGKVPVLSLDGSFWKHTEGCYAPSNGACQTMLQDLRQHLQWSRPMLAAFLGTSQDTVRRWESGERHPTGAAKRLIWLVNLLVRHPERLESGLDFLFWGQGDQIRKWMEACRTSDS